MPERLIRCLHVLAFVALCASGALATVWQAWDGGDALSRVDAFSEANAIRAAHGFLDRGLTATAGLPDVLYSSRYPDEGFASEAPERRTGVTAQGIYTHYPPGPEYLAVVAMKLLGPEPIAHLRLLPALLSAAAAVVFGLSIRRRFGALTGWIVIAACQALPTFADASTFLHYDGYAFALLLLEIALALSVTAPLPGFAVLGFCQGWLSFDYVFLVVLAPVAMQRVMRRLDDGENPPLATALRRCVAVGIGFTLAHALHFAEVCAWFGSVTVALQDLLGAAAHRSGAEQFTAPLQPLVTILNVLATYFVDATPIRTFFWHPPSEDPIAWQAFRFLGLTLGVWWLLLTAVMPIGSRRDGRLLDDWLAVSGWAFVSCAGWLCVMLDHAVTQHYFLFRHLFLGFLLLLLFVAERVVRPLASHSRKRAVGAAGVPP